VFLVDFFYYDVYATLLLQTLQKEKRFTVGAVCITKIF
jgi:hypothetical protein